jgi:hypothetical protein
VVVSGYVGVGENRGDARLAIAAKFDCSLLDVMKRNNGFD